MRAPQISVIVPAYNAATTISETLESALAQSIRASFEVIVVNDGSTDATGRILRGFGGRIKCIDQPNRGVSAARNAARRFMRGHLSRVFSIPTTSGRETSWRE